jgi:hypothetical protein
MGDILLWRPRQSNGSLTKPHDESAYAPIIEVLDVNEDQPPKLCAQCAAIPAERCYYPACPLYVGP